VKSSVAIATVSWIRNDEERDVVLETFSNLSQLNLPIITVDSGSSEEDQKKIASIKNVLFFKSKEGITKRLVFSQQEAAKHADYIFYLQSDKKDFAKNDVPKMIDYYVKQQEKGLLIPSRTKESFATYPSYQQKHEEFLNWFIGDYVKIEEDYYAGPKIYPATVTKYLHEIKGEQWWGIEAFIYVLAKKLNLPFAFFEVFINSPKDIGNNEFIKNYRTEVTRGQLDAFLQALQIELHS
jgi:hypothetical protein